MKREEQRLRRELLDLLGQDPFEPFQIKLVNGDVHHVFQPQNVYLTKTIVNIHSSDQNWALFPLDKIASIESLIADFPGEVARHTAP